MNRILTSLTVVSVFIAGCTAAPRAQPDTRTANAATEHCVVRSASRIPTPAGGCSITPGRVYSQQDVERTGQTSVGDALGMLDPSITVHH